MSNKGISTITEILSDIRIGKMVVLIDDKDRENEGDLVIAADHINADAINFMATYGRGLICLPMSEAHCHKLELSMMTNNNLSSHQTAFTVSIEAARGVTTGISAADRAHTIKTAVRKDASAQDLVQPGHIFPLKAKIGGVLTRAGHTEAACDLAMLSGLSEAGVICEILNSDGSMARINDLLNFANEHNLKIGTITDLIEYRMASEMLIESCGSEKVSIFNQQYILHIFRDKSTDDYHIALTYGIDINQKFDENEEVLTRVHYPFYELDFIRGIEISKNNKHQLFASLQKIQESKKGALIGLRSSKTADINIKKIAKRLKSPKLTSDEFISKNWDPKIYGTGAQIIRSLGIRKMRLLSHPINLNNIKGFGLEIMGFEDN